MGHTSVKSHIQNFGVSKIMQYVEGNPEENIPKLMKLIDGILPEAWYGKQRAGIRSAIDEKNNWYQLLLKIYDLDPEVRKTFFQNFIINASLNGTSKQQEAAKKYDCNVPWTILLDPTSACNLKCKGCWASEYGNRLNLRFEIINSIIEQGKELGIYFYIYTGGEPLVRKKELIKLCELHPDCEFLAFTNGTLIDEEFCKEMLRVKNFVPAISLEGFEDTNDFRRGEGVYNQVIRAMKLLKSNKLPFGISTCYTSKNFEVIGSEAFFDLMVDSGALFAWFFHYMPVGNDATTDLLPSPIQRVAVYDAIKKFRNTKPIFTMDFQNDAAHVGGCVAGGRNYFHINAKGDVEPCVFVHYSNANIHNCTLVEALQSPLFKAYRENQPFNKNHYLPCPMLENPETLRKMVKESNAVSTDYLSPEDIDLLCDKCKRYSDKWTPVAEQLWAERK